VRKRYRIERRDYCVVLAGRDFQVAPGQLEIRESKPRLVENPACRENVINRPYSEEIKFQLPRGLPCITCSLRRLDHQTEDALPRGKGQIVNIVDAALWFRPETPC
jgi:hypothetical protein